MNQAVELMRMLNESAGLDKDFRQQFDAVPRSQFDWATGRIDKLEKAIVAYLDAWEDCASLAFRERDALRAVVEWNQQEAIQRLNEQSMPDDEYTGGRV